MSISLKHPLSSHFSTIRLQSQYLLLAFDSYTVLRAILFLSHIWWVDLAMREFDYDLDYKNLNLREHPELYRVGRGEQGVLLVEPYKSEILPHWRFATPDVATESSDKIYHRSP